MILLKISSDKKLHATNAKIRKKKNKLINFKRKYSQVQNYNK